MVKPSIPWRAHELPCTWASTPRNHDMRGQEQRNGGITVVCLYCGKTEREITTDWAADD